MVKVTIELSVDPQNAEQLKTLVDLLKNSNEVAQPSQQAQAQDPNPENEPKPQRKPRTQKPAQAEVKNQEPEHEPEPEPMNEKPEEKAITIEQVRLLLASKVSNHRREIKDKLTELGANNVTTLDPGKYQEFTDFMQNLD